MFKLWKSVLLLAVVGMAGCGDPGPFRIQVTGKVTLDGEPVAFKSLTFLPTEGTAGHGAGGDTDGEGNYRLQAMVPGAIRDYRGCPPGRYRVVVSEPLIPPSGSQSDLVSQVVASEDEGPAPAVILFEPTRRRPVKGGIPAIYTSEKMSPLVVEVSEENEVIDLALDSKARPSLVSLGTGRRD